MGGENVPRPDGPEGLLGSSPRGRGKLPALWSFWQDVGLIPAWAGKTLSTSPTSSQTWAHPRVGGENAEVLLRRGIATGSSPRGRGKQGEWLRCSYCQGLIPAWAGKTRGQRRSPLTARAHPRVGGENSDGLTPTLARTGSSPRGRGKPDGLQAAKPVERLIPAWAGKTGALLYLLRR